MKRQRIAILTLFALILASSLTSFGCYSATSRRVHEDMDRALALALKEQQVEVISPDTIRTFNRHLQIAELRGRATLSVDTRSPKFTAHARCSKATIFSLSDQRPATILWLLTGLWLIFLLARRGRTAPAAVPCEAAVPGVGGIAFGGLTFSSADSRFYASDGRRVQLTPMQHQLLEMFFHSPSHSLTKTEICDALWPKKPDANATLYTLIRRMKPVIEQHSLLKIESDRNRAYVLALRDLAG